MLVLHILRAVKPGVELQNQYITILVAVTTDPLTCYQPSITSSYPTIGG